MNSFWKRHRSFAKPLAEALETWRWLVLTVIGLSLLWVEVQEFLVLKILNQAFHYFEVFQYSVLLISTGLLTELFARSNRAHKQAVRILEYKHRLSLELTGNNDWDDMLRNLTAVPRKIADVDETYLLVENSLSKRYDIAGHWVDEKQPTMAWDPTIPCSKCIENASQLKPAFHLCGGDNATGGYVYSLEVSNQNIPTTILKFRVRPEAKLSRWEEEIFNNIRDEIVVALQASQDRRRISEMQSAEVAMAERRIVSTYVHDQLGQNLGFMHMKLDQLGGREKISDTREMRDELKRLREVANESYEIVRDFLKKLQPETIPHLTNLLQEHARTVARRARFTLSFKSTGTPTHLSANTQQLIFFTFHEILSNVEKHANADTVEVLVAWSDDLLDISVTDNGKGFDPEAVKRDEHFGLGIMRERIANIKGRLTIHSSADAGTVVSISIPVETIAREVPA